MGLFEVGRAELRRVEVQPPCSYDLPQLAIYYGVDGLDRDVERECGHDVAAQLFSPDALGFQCLHQQVDVLVAVATGLARVHGDGQQTGRRQIAVQTSREPAWYNPFTDQRQPRRDRRRCHG